MVQRAKRKSQSEFSLAWCLVTALLTVISGIAIWCLFSALSGALAFAGTSSPGDVQPLKHPRIIVVQHQRMLHLLDGRRWVKSYRVGLGRLREGRGSADSGYTPIGNFYICSRNHASRFHRFLGISYPDEQAVSRGLAEGLISRGQAEAIREALRHRRQPDWTTPLGGGIGLHGGGGDRDWTAGCIALDDRAIEELDSVLQVGDPVEILP
jgi:hypothetical protein